ncbi:MAG: hypothetical protein SGPRY_008945, partial [Prymnesium sp.]
LSTDSIKRSVGVFREGIDFSVENTVAGAEDYMARLTQRVADNHDLCEGEEERVAIDHVMRMVAAADFDGAKPRRSGRGGGGKPTQKARVLFEYQPLSEGHLTLTEGDVVSVASQGEDGWWEGELKGQRGLFPGNFVVLLDTDTSVAAVGHERGQERPELWGEQVQEQ